MAKLIVFIVSIVMFLVGIFLTAVNVGIGILLTIVGVLVMLCSGILLITSGGFRTEGFFNLRPHREHVERVQLPKKEVTNIWDEMAQKRDEK